MRKELVAVLDQALTPELKKRLLGYAYKLAVSRSWPGEGDLRELAQDVVSDAICKTVTGERRWEPEAVLDSASGPLPKEVVASLSNHLFSSVKSLVYARNKNNENKVHRQSLDAAKEMATVDPPAWERLEANDFFCGMYIALDGDEACCRMLDLFDRKHQPSEVREVLREGSDGQPKLSIQEIYAAEKRLRRKTRDYLHEIKGQRQ